MRRSLSVRCVTFRGWLFVSAIYLSALINVVSADPSLLDPLEPINKDSDRNISRFDIPQDMNSEPTGSFAETIREREGLTSANPDSVAVNDGFIAQGRVPCAVGILFSPSHLAQNYISVNDPRSGVLPYYSGNRYSSFTMINSLRNSMRFGGTASAMTSTAESRTRLASSMALISQATSLMVYGHWDDRKANSTSLLKQTDQIAADLAYGGDGRTLFIGGMGFSNGDAKDDRQNRLQLRWNRIAFTSHPEGGKLEEFGLRAGTWETKLIAKTALEQEQSLKEFGNRIGIYGRIRVTTGWSLTPEFEWFNSDLTDKRPLATQSIASNELATSQIHGSLRIAWRQQPRQYHSQWQLNGAIGFDDGIISPSGNQSDIGKTKSANAGSYALGCSWSRFGEKRLFGSSISFNRMQTVKQLDNDNYRDYFLPLTMLVEYSPLETIRLESWLKPVNQTNSGLSGTMWWEVRNQPLDSWWSQSQHQQSIQTEGGQFQLDWLTKKFPERSIRYRFGYYRYFLSDKRDWSANSSLTLSERSGTELLVPVFVSNSTSSSGKVVSNTWLSTVRIGYVRLKSALTDYKSRKMTPWEVALDYSWSSYSSDLSPLHITTSVGSVGNWLSDEIDDRTTIRLTLSTNFGHTYSTGNP